MFRGGGPPNPWKWQLVFFGSLCYSGYLNLKIKQKTEQIKELKRKYELSPQG